VDIIADLERRLRRAERQVRRIDKAEEERRGSPSACRERRRAFLREMAELSFALDALRQAYARRRSVMGPV